MKELIGKKVLVTSNGWFFGNDGMQYKAIYGTLKAIHTSENTLGFTPSRTHTNWYLEVGNTTIAGCQVLHCVQSDVCNTGEVSDFTSDRTHESTIKGRHAESYIRPSYIYNSDL